MNEREMTQRQKVARFEWNFFDSLVKLERETSATQFSEELELNVKEFRMNLG